MGRVLLLRAAEDERGLRYSLQQLGHEAVRVPLFERRWRIPAMVKAATEHPIADWILFTSPTSVEVFAAGAPTAWQRARIAAVGLGTVRKLAMIGRPPDLVPPEHTGDSLLRALPDLRNQVVLYPHAVNAPSGTATALQNLGATVIHIHAFDAPLPDVSSNNLRSALPVDATAILSVPSASRLVEQLHTLRSVRSPSDLGLILTIGPHTSAAVRNLGLPVHGTANPPTLNGLLQMIDAMVQIFI